LKVYPGDGPNMFWQLCQHTLAAKGSSRRFVDLTKTFVPAVLRTSPRMHPVLGFIRRFE
jgi:hypothetical protein